MQSLLPLSMPHGRSRLRWGLINLFFLFIWALKHITDFFAKSFQFLLVSFYASCFLRLILDVQAQQLDVQAHIESRAWTPGPERPWPLLLM
jgi:hypothetical protein